MARIRSKDTNPELLSAARFCLPESVLCDAIALGAGSPILPSPAGGSLYSWMAASGTVTRVLHVNRLVLTGMREIARTKERDRAANEA